MMDPEGIAEEGIMIIMLWPLSSHLRPGIILTWTMQLLLSSSCPGLVNYRFKSFMVIQPQSFQLVFVLTNQLQMSIVLSKTWKSSAKVTKKYKVNSRGQKWATICCNSNNYVFYVTDGWRVDAIVHCSVTLYHTETGPLLHGAQINDNQTKLSPLPRVFPLPRARVQRLSGSRSILI